MCDKANKIKMKNYCKITRTFDKIAISDDNLKII